MKSSREHEYVYVHEHEYVCVCIYIICICPYTTWLGVKQFWRWSRNNLSTAPIIPWLTAPHLLFRFTPEKAREGRQEWRPTSSIPHLVQTRAVQSFLNFGFLVFTLPLATHFWKGIAPGSLEWLRSLQDDLKRFYNLIFSTWIAHSWNI